MAKSTRNQPGENPTTRTKTKWTVMVYMAASKDDQTEGAAIRDLREMEKVGSSEDTAVVVQLDRDWPGHPERYLVEKGRSKLFRVDSGIIDWWLNQSSDPVRREERRSSSGNPEVLEEFLTSVYAAYDSEYYLLVLWGHAFGLGFGRDHGDPLTVEELAHVLAKFKKELGPDRKLLIGTNACAMSYAEAVYQLRSAAHYLIASEITMPFAGWPYARILQGLAAQKSDVDAGEFIIDQFMESFARQGVSLTLVNLGQAEALSGHLNALATALTDGISSSAVGQRVADAFLDSAHGDVRPLVDLTDLCRHLHGTDDTIGAQAAKFLQYLGAASPDDTTAAKRRKLIVKHEFDPDFEGLYGLGIFAPAVTSATDLRRLELRRSDYEELELVQPKRNSWASFVYHHLGELLEPTNAAAAELVARTGASSQEEREGVLQLLVSVNRAFAKVENAVEDVERNIKNALDDDSERHEDAARRPRNAEAPQPSLSFLRLFDENDSLGGGSAPVGGGKKQRSSPLRIVPKGTKREKLDTSLRLLEDAVATSERTIRRVLTNGRLGLGQVDDPVKPGMGPGDSPPKPGLGADDPVKPGFGEVDDPVKPGMGEVDDPVKPGMGSLPDDQLVAARPETVSTVALFRMVAGSLRGLEAALAGLERVTLGTVADGRSSSAELKARTSETARRAVGTVKDQLESARETTFWVLRHPTYGLGPGSLNSTTRRHLASAGGLNTRFLRLL